MADTEKHAGSASAPYRRLGRWPLGRAPAPAHRWQKPAANREIYSVKTDRAREFPTDGRVRSRAIDKARNAVPARATKRNAQRWWHRFHRFGPTTVRVRAAQTRTSAHPHGLFRSATYFAAWRFSSPFVAGIRLTN